MVRRAMAGLGFLGLAWMAGPGGALGQSYVAFRYYDRPLFYPYEGYTADHKSTPGGKAGFDPTYRYRAMVNLELGMTPLLENGYALVRVDVKLRQPSETEVAHFNPLAVDMGGGMLFRLPLMDVVGFWGNEHYFNDETHIRDYGYLEVRHVF
ncbi:MAG: hypothetical protein OEW12_09610 [Deltaproteobacteria bacterium]|nr:hypothetical protein [Deltaproteobacteria bacterium]